MGSSRREERESFPATAMAVKAETGTRRPPLPHRERGANASRRMREPAALPPMAGTAAAGYFPRHFPAPPISTMRALLPTLLLPFLTALTAQEPKPTPAPTPTPAPAPADQKPAMRLDETTWDHFGTGITEGKDAVDLARFGRKIVGFADTGVMRITGEVTSVCQAKGCWMTLGKGEPPLLVKFKDYAFFMPKDASGRTAIVEGTLTVKQETVEETKHYLEDAGKHDEAAKVTEGRKVAQFMASGVALKKVMKKLDEKTWDHFGAGITEGAAATEIAEMLKSPDKFTGKEVRLTGEIQEICQKKGCWMTLGKQQPPVFVKFKDYAFFMPKDGAGRTAIVEGTLTMKQETVEETKHYLEDAGKHDEAAKVTEGRKLFHFMASGVALKKNGA